VTNPDLTYIGILVDRSGSMDSMCAEMEFALNAFLTQQADQPGQARVSLAQFDNVYEAVYAWQPIDDVLEYQLEPRNSTALLDAIAQFVGESGATLSALPEDERPGTVLIVIITDGYENASRLHTADSIKAMIRLQQDKYSWQFVFLGANIDSISVANSYGINGDSTMDFAGCAAPEALASLGAYTSRLRRTGSAVFTTDERAAAMGRPAVAARWARLAKPHTAGLVGGGIVREQ